MIFEVNLDYFSREKVATMQSKAGGSRGYIHHIGLRSASLHLGVSYSGCNPNTNPNTNPH